MVNPRIRTFPDVVVPLIATLRKAHLQLQSSADYSQVPPETASPAMSRLGAIETVIVLVILSAAVQPGEL